jgi:hypothetical protein
MPQRRKVVWVGGTPITPIGAVSDTSNHECGIAARNAEKSTSG